MKQKVNTLFDRLSEYLSQRKGLLPLTGVLLVIANFALQFVPGAGWLGSSDLLLHTGIVLAIIGFLIAWAL